MRSKLSGFGAAIPPQRVIDARRDYISQETIELEGMVVRGYWLLVSLALAWETPWSDRLGTEPG